MTVKEAIIQCKEKINEKDICLFSTGYISRYGFHHLRRNRNFYMVGSMGLLSSIGIGLALSTDSRIILFDGDGSFLMGLHTLPLIKLIGNKPFIHVVLNNRVYASTGGQDVPLISFSDAARFYEDRYFVNDLSAFYSKGPTLLVLNCDKEKEPCARVNLPCPTYYNLFKKEIK